MTPAAQNLPITSGHHWPMGVTCARLDGQRGLNAAVFAPDATAIELCLFDETGERETARLRLPACTDGVWHGFVAGPGAGQRYGLRAHGPWRPQAGHRFDPSRLLIDPWARALGGPLAALALETAYDSSPASQAEPADNASRMPLARVLDLDAELAQGAAIAPGPGTAASRTVLYEAHVKSLTALHPQVPPAQRGHYAGVASPVMLAHYRRLGITALCLMPVQLHMDERALIERGLTNHWGYNTLAFFVPDPQFATPGIEDLETAEAAARSEFRAMVDTLHRHGIEVILDVVYNHTAEGDALGPTLSWRGLANARWYALDAAGNHLNPSGCGNTLNMAEPRVLQFVMDSLRWWVQAYGVDGFRFDLAVALGRGAADGGNFRADSAFLAALAQDPVLSRVKHIAEPWDIGPNGYQIGRFGHGWQEWNDQFRDTARAWWLGHDCTRGEIARRLAGSSDLFQHDGRSPAASINFITAHDGFTLADLTMYRDKHNEANGEGNRDGHDYNLSANFGVEGPTDNAAVTELRKQHCRALLAHLLCAQGTPQLLAGDEIGHSQQGNNNAYCQDNAITWLDWAGGDEALTAFVAALVQLRLRHPGLRHPHWFTGRAGVSEGGSREPAHPDIAWRLADGTAPDTSAWELPDGRLLACVITVGEDGQPATERLLLVLLAGEDALDLRLPDGDWHWQLDSARSWASGMAGEANGSPPPAANGMLHITPPSVLVLTQPTAEHVA